VVFDVKGTMLRVQKVQELQPARHTILGWDVHDIRAEVEGLTKRGVQFERFDGLARMSWVSGHPWGGKIAWFKDPDGNTLSLTQFQ